MYKPIPLCLGMLLLFTGCPNEHDDLIHIHSIIEIVVSPSRFEEKTVQLRGYYSTQPPGSFLYLTREHARMSDTTNAVRLWKTLDGTDMNSHKKCTERFLLVQGRYTEMDFGGYGLTDIELAVVIDVGDEIASGICYRHSSRGG